MAYAVLKAGSLLTKVIADRGRITVPGWTVRLTAPESVHPEMSIAWVLGLYSSTNSAVSPAAGECWISEITMAGAAGWLPGTRASLAKAVRRAWMLVNSRWR